MKTKLLIFISLIALSCKKDEIKPNKPQEICNCGLVVSDNVQDYSVVIRNSCSGNEKRFYLQQGDWMNAHPGSDYCITNVNNW
jgi:hypothetical protein